MKTSSFILAVTLILTAAGCTLPTGGSDTDPNPDPGKPAGSGSQLVKFSTAAELKTYLDQVSEEVSSGNSGGGEVMSAAPTTEPDSSEEGDSSNNEEITNNQEAGVDEGGIVKNYKDFLIVLRQGRLYTVRIGGKSGLEKVSDLSVAAEGLDTHVWYDEVLVDEARVIVIGYRYSILPATGTWYKNSATELNLFTITEDGQLVRGETYFIESGDYYSWNNYASRMNDGKLVLYMPYYSSYLWEKGEAVRLPGLYQYRNGSLESKGSFFQESDVIKPLQDTSWPTFHVVSVCTLDSELNCQSNVVLGPWSRAYYVSTDAAYLFLSQASWYDYDDAETVASDSEETENNTNLLYRLSLDGTSSGAVSIDGEPFDQFSLSESSESSAQISVFVTSYHATSNNGYRSYQPDQALVRVPISDFDEQGTEVAADRYLLMPDHDIYKARFHNKRLVYGSDENLGIVDIESGNITQLDSPFYVYRIEPAGSRVMIFGSDNWGLDPSLSMASVALGGEDSSPTLGAVHMVPLYQGEWRSHGYAYHEEGEGLGTFGLATLEIREKETSDNSENEYDIYLYDYEYIPSVSFFTISSDGTITDAEKMTESASLKTDNTCTTSCIDWYGDSRPIFLGDDIIGLMGDQMQMDATHLNFVSGDSE